MFTVSDVVGTVADKLRGRTDLITYNGTLGSDIPSWILHSVMDLTPNFPFEELVVKGPLVNFTVNVSEYPISYFLDPANQDSFTEVRTFFRYYTTSNPVNLGDPGNELKCRSTAVVQSKSNISGLPTVWCQNGTNLLFGFCPDQAYSVMMRFQRKHPLVTNGGLNQIMAHPIYMPNDWMEVLGFAAAIKGCDYCGMTEIGNNYYQKMHGDPKNSQNIGLLREKISQMQRNLNHNERQLQPIVSRYCR